MMPRPQSFAEFTRPLLATTRHDSLVPVPSTLERIAEVAQAAAFTFTFGARLHPVNGYGNDFAELRVYRDAVRHQQKTDRTNPSATETLADLLAIVPAESQYHLKRFSWSAQSPVLDRVLIALGAFTDEHLGQPIQECFPISRIHEYLRRVLDGARETGTPATLAEQFALAVPYTDGDLYTSGVFLSLAFRTVARNCDKRVSSTFSFPMEYRLAMARAVAQFPESLSTERDSLGDTYLYWAQFTGGVIATAHPSTVVRGFAKAIFCATPYLMQVVREGICLDPMIFGVHRRVDHAGFRTGERAAVHIGYGNR